MKRLKITKILAFLVLVLSLGYVPMPVLAQTSDSQEGKVLPRPAQPTPVVDEAGLFSAAVKSQLIDSLKALSNYNGSQVVVVTVNSLNGLEKAEYAYTLGDEWGIGQQGMDNGVVILIKPKTGDTSEGKGQVFIAPGRGAEGVLPDAFCSELVNDVMIPKFKQNDYEGAVLDVVKIIAPMMRGEYSVEDYEKLKHEDDALYAWLGSSLCCLWPFLLFFWYYFLRRTFIPKRRWTSGSSWSSSYYDDDYGSSRHSSSSWSSSSSSSGGGYSYGGGSFGGGGAGGSW